MAFFRHFACACGLSLTFSYIARMLLAFYVAVSWRMAPRMSVWGLGDAFPDSRANTGGLFAEPRFRVLLEDQSGSLGWLSSRCCDGGSAREEFATGFCS